MTLKSPQSTPHQRTYGTSTPCPCDDCRNHDFCLKNSMCCVVSRYWENMGNVKMHAENDKYKRKGLMLRIPDEHINHRKKLL